MRRIVALAIVGALLITATEVHAKRLALVIGIDAYDNLGPGAQLKKAVSDARTIAATLKELDFAVAMVENPRRAELFGAWQRFIVAEDVVTRGGRVQETIDIVRAHGGIVAAVATLVDRSGGNLPDFGCPFVSLTQLEVETFEAGQLPPDLVGTPAVKPGSK